MKALDTTDLRYDDTHEAGFQTCVEITAQLNDLTL